MIARRSVPSDPVAFVRGGGGGGGVNPVVRASAGATEGLRTRTAGV